ncbi:MAG: nuclear transport factor 2 family protein [Candidatus Hodarchaeales archaeon]|jgi:hypothetical protein
MSLKDTNDLHLIQESVENYFRGVIEGDYSKVVKAWHVEGNRMSVDSKSNTILFKNSPAHSEYANYHPQPGILQTALIEAIDITGSAASVRLKREIRTHVGSSTCTDYLLLLKIQDVWIIVSKVSYKE